MAIVKINDPKRIGHWPGHMEADYVYSLGIALESFFKELRDNGNIMGSRCETCGTLFVPWRLFCPKCHGKIWATEEANRRG